MLWQDLDGIIVLKRLSTNLTKSNKEYRFLSKNTVSWLSYNHCAPEVIQLKTPVSSHPDKPEGVINSDNDTIHFCSERSMSSKAKPSKLLLALSFHPFFRWQDPTIMVKILLRWLSTIHRIKTHSRSEDICSAEYSKIKVKKTMTLIDKSYKMKENT